MDKDLRFYIIPKMKGESRTRSWKNDGDLSEAEIRIFDEGRVYVKVSNNVESTYYITFLKGTEKY
ncbi:MAG TPA: hypothetical protein DEO65_07515 [Bacillus bacterium]|uniref:Uncharacterized protein n=1 Tax=Siminovitchia fordii TaxID=254759 RepID=A0ABQ4KAJ1_9BACI|nr:hypothetical protein J1TS3_38780 [Siminovitchia fordii]HBZ09710.1 hypothetical protein [Bacillus sp. (in: firmicutes)]